MSKSRIAWLKKNLLPAAVAQDADTKNHSVKRTFRKVKRFWRELPTPAKQALARDIESPDL